MRFGYIDTSGTMIIEPRFAAADSFCEGMACVGDRDQGDGGKWGAIDRSGTLVVPMQYDRPLLYSEGLAAVRSAGTWRFIDKTGASVLGPFASAGNFSEGLAYVECRKSGRDHSQQQLRPTTGSDPGGRLAENGTGAWLRRRGSTQAGSVLYGYIDTSGDVVIEPRFEWAYPFSEGLAVVALAVDGKTKYGYIDTTGTVVIEPQFDGAGSFSEGLAAVMLRETYAGGDDFETTGYIDTSGAIVIPVQYSEVSNFAGGIAAVVFRDAVWEPPTT